MFQRHPIQNDAVLFVTTNMQNRKLIFSDPACAREAIDTLYRTQQLHPFFLYGFVIMPDHCHFLMAVPPLGSISRIMRVFKYGVSFNIGMGPIWQSRFVCEVSNDAHAILNYIHQNPVRAGLVESAELYPWSSASGKWDVTEIDWL